ncbi:MAG: peroxiredoxin-like family protein [Polyangiaceae bacterium]
MTSEEPGVDGEQWVARVAAVQVLSLDGELVRLRNLWSSGPTVTAFLRHFGCLFCHQMVHDVLAAVPAIVERGARVVLVGNGSTDEARRFFEAKGLPRDGCMVLTDPERASYRAAGAAGGYMKTFFNGGSQRAFARARAEGHRITGLFGDLTQLGAVLVTRPPAQLGYLHRSRYAGDHPIMAAVLDAVAAPATGGTGSSKPPA